MGNLCSCCTPKPIRKKSSKRFSNSQPGIGSSNRWNKIRSSKKEKLEDTLIQEQAIAAAILFRHHQQNGTLPPFDRSASLRYPVLGSKKQSLPRSSSSRARSLTDPLLQVHQFVNQDIKIDDLETKHFVLVHGGGFGAWCWYKTIALLVESGFKVDAIDLTGSGIHSFDTNNITSLSQYVKPLTDFLEKLGDGEKVRSLSFVLKKASKLDLYKNLVEYIDQQKKRGLWTDYLSTMYKDILPCFIIMVILAGHDFGGACISYAAELFPLKVAKAVFIAAAMLNGGQSTLDMFSQQAVSNGPMQQAQIFLYANGNDHAPTAIDLNKTLLGDLLFNQSPSKDVALASVSMRPIPFAPILEKLSLSDKNYGSVRRFYIETTEDNAIPLSLQKSMINSNPPEQVFQIKGSDHSPFFSKPQALHKILIEISTIPAIKV